MIHDFKQKKVFRLVAATIWNRTAKWRKDHEKVRYSKQLSRARDRAREAEREAAKNNTPVTKAAPARAVPELLLCQSKLRTFDTIMRLALNEAGVRDKAQDNARTAQRHALLRKAGKRPAPFRPKVYENVTPELRLRTSQASLAMSAGCDVRTVQRHLNDLEALGFVKLRQRTAPDKYRSINYQLLLNGDFLEWLEIRVNEDGTTVDAGADRSPVLALATVPTPQGPPPGPEPPGASPAALGGLVALAALRKKLSLSSPQG